MVDWIFYHKNHSHYVLVIFYCDKIFNQAFNCYRSDYGNSVWNCDKSDTYDCNKNVNEQNNFDVITIVLGVALW